MGHCCGFANIASALVAAAAVSGRLRWGSGVTLECRKTTTSTNDFVVQRSRLDRLLLFLDQAKLLACSTTFLTDKQLADHIVFWVL